MTATLQVSWRRESHVRYTGLMPALLIVIVIGLVISGAFIFFSSTAYAPEERPDTDDPETFVDITDDLKDSIEKAGYQINE